MTSEGMHEEQLRQLTGCRYAVIVRLETLLSESLDRKKRGAPLKRPIRTVLVMALMKLRGGQPYRTLEAIWRIPHVTLQRYTVYVCSMLSRIPLGQDADSRRDASHPAWLVVDTTSTRVRSTAASHYSGYKHHRCLKVQVIVDDGSRVRFVSDAYPGPVHDKSVWNREFDKVMPLLGSFILGDKAYAGAEGEGTVLFRPIKHNETAWRSDSEGCRTFNRILSRRRVRIEHVFAQLKAFRLIRDQFPLRWDRYAVVFRAIALIHTVTVEMKEGVQTV